MGLDLMLFVEYATDNPPFAAGASALSWGPWPVPRSRQLFDALGAAPRGLPAQCTRIVFEDFYLRVIFPHEEDDWRGSAYIASADATRWIEEGASHYVSQDGATWVSDPNAIDPSWLTAREFAQAIAATEDDSLHDVEVDLLLDVLAAAERRLGPDRVRVVFWFL